MTKIEEIINKNFDNRLSAMVTTYIVDKGYSFCQKITDEEIDSLEDNPLMTSDFVKALVRTAREVCQNCTIDEIIGNEDKYPQFTKERLIEIATTALDELSEVLEDYEFGDIINDNLDMTRSEKDFFEI